MQLADPFYPRKLNALFYEFEEIGLNAQLGYGSAADIAVSYPRFFWTKVKPYVPEALSCLALSANGTVLATGSEDRSVKLWDGSIGRLLTARAVLPDGQGPATFAAWAGGNLVSGDGKQWRCRPAGDLGRQPVAFAGGFGCVLSVARSPVVLRVALIRARSSSVR